ncbi:DUF4436 domain-containing protein [Mycobacterium paraseoulense]|uniref:DUF4436 domain-containing protein n=1 Tax=Mycobacterium paraseoulense TaxID=590652 RepID=A0A1X0I3Q0_9MYCO|nr:DUF4436 domain-containing protein [Mycobacterium paraseoulense]MCV7394738.1 DUF4436 domain-containing protein [Mycobacterium paraseoulense]ORB33984.1 DUF4436 domain-containing protein [Mycobacterium paraseoulense]BBZ73667.1 DUF4436 domain-containing protein [Mycobacterium paraseoulense]
MRFAVVGLIVSFVAAYVASVALYAQSRTAHHRTEVPAAGAASVATFSVEDIQSNYSVLVVNLAISPGSALLDPQTQHLNEDLSLWVRSAASPTRRTWTKGMLPGVFPVPVTIAGEIERWPFDRYDSGPIEVELLHGGEGGVPERLPATFVNHLPGWQVAASNGGGLGPYRVTLQRSLSAAAFGIVICGVLITIAALGLFVAVQTLRDRRKFQPPMTTWYAAMLFAVVPLRNALPGSPPFGGWIDITIVLWVLVVLVIAMLLYIACWWRHLRPDAQQPGAPAP